MRNIFLLLAFLCAPAFAQDTDPVQLVENKDTLQSELRIGTNDGRVDLGDVFRAISRFNGYDDSELRLALPNAEISLDGSAARWSIAAVNKVLRPCVEVNNNGETLDIVVDRESARQWVNTRKANVRWAWDQVDWRSEPPTYGIEMVGSIESTDKPAKPVEEEKDIVLLIHGLNSRPEDVSAFIPLIEQAHLTAATFRYPNDQPIDQSSALLSDELKRIATKHPNRKVRLLTHSMGGLVARGAIETKLDPGNVTQLIMIAPPNQGSALARVATFMDCYEFCTSSHHRRSGVLVESVSDGLGEATADLAPHSVFLDRINHQKRNPDVRYTILIGTGGPMNEDEMNHIRKTVREYSDGNPFTRFLSSKLNDSLDGLDEVVQGKGDGVVSCDRAKLDGVADIVELPFSHAGILGSHGKASKEAYAVIRDRLAK